METNRRSESYENRVERQARDIPLKKAVAGLLIGTGVLAAGGYIAYNQLSNDAPDRQSTDANTNNTITTPPDSWPEIPETPLPKPEILDPSVWKHGDLGIK